MLRSIVWGAVVAGVLALPPSASADQLFGVQVGYFAVRGEDARVNGDVLNENRNFFAFRIPDFNNAAVNGEWLVGIGDYFEAGVGVGYYRRTVPSVYRDFVNDNGSEIRQDFKLRILPVTTTIRLFPISRLNGFQPYVGGGLGIYNWRYSETGEFIDFTDFSIFRDSFVAEGTDVGPVAMLGARFRVAYQVMISGEFRYQGGDGRVGIENGFLADRIDLGGYTTLFGVHVGF